MGCRVRTSTGTILLVSGEGDGVKRVRTSSTGTILLVSGELVGDGVQSKDIIDIEDDDGIMS